MCVRARDQLVIQVSNAFGHRVCSLLIMLAFVWFPSRSDCVLLPYLSLSLFLLLSLTLSSRREWWSCARRYITASNRPSTPCSFNSLISHSANNRSWAYAVLSYAAFRKIGLIRTGKKMKVISRFRTAASQLVVSIQRHRIYGTYVHSISLHRHCRGKCGLAHLKLERHANLEWMHCIRKK